LRRPAATNLIVNGDFEAGNTDFTSGYTYFDVQPFVCMNDLMNGRYSVMGDGDCKLHPFGFWATLSGHTTGTPTDQYLYIQAGAWGAGDTGSQVVWSQTVSGLTVGTNYQWCYFVADNVANWDSTNAFNDLQGHIGARAGYSAAIDGTVVTSVNPFPYLTSKVAANWVQQCHDYTATASSVLLELNNANLYKAHGNDWVVDDITFVAVAPPPPPPALGSVGTRVWNDLDGDGVQDAGEPGLPGVVVTLDDGNPATTDPTVTTDANGDYKITDVAQGTYTIKTSSLPAGAQPTFDADGTASANASTVTISDAHLDDTVQNFGYSMPASISGTVYFDANDDGAIAPGEPGLANVNVTLTGTAGDGSVVNLVTTTAADGSYSFPNLKPGTSVVSEAQPTAWRDGRESAPAGTATTTNDVITVTLTSNTPISGVNFGELGWTVSGAVALDETNTPLDAVSLALTGTDVIGNPVSLSTQTIAGVYSFSNVAPGTYKVTETQPVGLAEGLVQPDNLIEVALAADASNNNFSELAGSISGFVFVDKNRDGIMDAGESPIGGVTMTLTGTDAGGNEVTLTVQTDGDGHYSFTDLRSGDYTLIESQPIGFGDVSTTAGSSGGDAGSNTVLSIKLSPGAQATDYRFGETAAQLPATGSGTDAYATVLLALALILVSQTLLSLRRRRRIG
jgi:LPXTG-motif cell wall-anchored protein